MTPSARALSPPGALSRVCKQGHVAALIHRIRYDSILYEIFKVRQNGSLMDNHLIVVIQNQKKMGKRNQKLCHARGVIEV